MKKLIVLNVLGLAVVIGLVAMLAWNASHARDVVSSMESVTRVEREANEIRNQMVAMSDAMRGFLLNPSNRSEYDKKKAADAALVAAVERLLEGTDDARYEELAQAIGDLDEQQLDPIENEILDMAARDPRRATSTYFERYLPVRVKQAELVDQLRAKANESFDAEVAAADAGMTSLRRLAIYVGGGLVLLMVGASAWAARTATSLSSRVATNTVTLAESADAVLAAARGVASSAQSLSQGATEQAASLEETSASMEEMSSMTRRNAENSQNAAALMTTVEQQVRTSNQALGEMVSAMSGIEDSSQQVARIIKTIDEIAFQTNILALNAAVEAARAGEAGMGFAVVADEVRNLAQRSAQAAKDTAGLIEASITRAQDGSSRVEQVAKAITTITQSVSQVKGLVDEVSVASRQQSQGIDQVSQAIAQMEKVTQTTAATAEESAAASEELNAQAEVAAEAVRDLQRLVGQAGSRPRAHAPALATDTPASYKLAA